MLQNVLDKEQKIIIKSEGLDLKLRDFCADEIQGVVVILEELIIDTNSRTFQEIKFRNILSIKIFLKTHKFKSFLIESINV